MTPETIDYGKLYKCVEHEAFLNNPLYANSSLDEAIVQLLKDFAGFQKDDGFKVVEIMRDAFGNGMNKIDMLWVLHKQTRTEEMLKIFKEVVLEDTNWSDWSVKE